MSIDKEQVKKAIFDTYYADDVFAKYLASVGDDATPDERLASVTNDNTKLWDIFAEEVRKFVLRSEDVKAGKIDKDKYEKMLHAEDEFLIAAYNAQEKWSKALGFYDALEECKKEIAEAEANELKSGVEHLEDDSTESTEEAV